ncbi:MAG: hypothetical protein RAK22_00345 [Nanoarchaeota archaeon]|nr:hypothetical protein [Nanoarchaeota archaeon]
MNTNLKLAETKAGKLYVNEKLADVLNKNVGSNVFIPLADFYLLKGRLPSDDEVIYAEKDGGRSAILPKEVEYNGKKYYIGVKGVGTYGTLEIPYKDKEINEKLNEYKSKLPNKYDQGEDYLITSERGNMKVGAGRPIGGQSRDFALWDLEFSKKLDKDFMYPGTEARFVPTIAVAEYNNGLDEIISKTYSRDHYEGKVVQEYRLLPSTRELKDFLYKDKQERSNICKDKKKWSNLEKSLLAIALLPLNTIDPKTRNYLSPLHDPLNSSMAAESVIDPKDGTVYWKDLDNLAFDKFTSNDTPEQRTYFAMDKTINEIQAAISDLTAARIDIDKNPINALERVLKDINGIKIGNTQIYVKELTKEKLDNDRYKYRYEIHLNTKDDELKEIKIPLMTYVNTSTKNVSTGYQEPLFPHKVEYYSSGGGWKTPKPL